jgi:hypothetical protein
MIASGDNDAALEQGVIDHDAPAQGVWVRRGIALLEGAVTDQRTLAQGRLGRDLAALDGRPDIQLVFGIDDDTALVAHGNHVAVIGRSAVVVLDARGAKRRGPGKGIEGARMFILGDGDRFVTATGEAIPSLVKRSLAAGARMLSADAADTPPVPAALSVPAAGAASAPSPADLSASASSAASAARAPSAPPAAGADTDVGPPPAVPLLPFVDDAFARFLGAFAAYPAPGAILPAGRFGVRLAKPDDYRALAEPGRSPRGLPRNLFAGPLVIDLLPAAEAVPPADPPAPRGASGTGSTPPEQAAASQAKASAEPQVPPKPTPAPASQTSKHPKKRHKRTK